MTDKKTTTKKAITKKPAKKAPIKAAKKSVSQKAVAKKPVVSLPNRFAVIKTGGKQYVVYEGKKYDFEKLSGEEGKDITFDQVLLVANGENVKIGEPTVSGAKVTGKVTSQFKDKKVTVLKYKKRKRYRKTTGHRQQKTKVEITKIS